MVGNSNGRKFQQKLLKKVMTGVWWGVSRGMYWSAHTAITKYHRLAGLSDRSLFLTVLEAGES